MNACTLAEDVAQWWANNHGRKHGSLNSSWAGRDARNLFCWATLAVHVMARAQDTAVELELVEDAARQPTALLIHHGDDHRALDIELRGSRLLRLRDEVGAVVASVVVGRAHHGFTQAIAKAVTAALHDIRSMPAAMELG